MTLAYWPNIKRSLPTNVQREFRGVNRLDPLTIDDRFSSDQENVTTEDYPVMKTRPGYSLVGTTLPARILGLSSWKNTELHAISNANWYRFTAGAWTSVGSGFSTSAQWSFANFQGGFTDVNLIGVNGISAQRWDGATLQALTGVPAGLNYIENYEDRLWGAVGSTLHFSEFRVGTNWTTTTGADSDPGFITVETTDGEVITGIRNGPRRLIIFKKDSMWNLFGNYAEAFTLKRVHDSIGAISNQSIATCNQDIYFVHYTGIYVYSGGTSATMDFSIPVLDYVQRINPAAADKVCAGTDGKMVYFALPLDTATEPSHILEYNTDHGTWAVWRNYQGLSYALQQRTAYVGNADGTVREIGGSTSDNGTAISGYYTTKVFGGQSFAQKLRWKRAWTNAIVPTGSSLSAYLTSNPDRTNGFTLVQNIPNSTDLSAQRVIIPTTSAYNTNYIALKLSFTGPVTVKEIAWEQESLPAY